MQPLGTMSHSLSLADRAIEDDVAIGVLLADKPLCQRVPRIHYVLRASRDADVTFPQRNGEPGIRSAIGTRTPLRRRLHRRATAYDRLRDQSQLIAQAVETTDEGAFFDVDTRGVRTLRALQQTDRRPLDLPTCDDDALPE